MSDAFCAVGIKCKDTGLKQAGTVLEQGFGGKTGKVIWGIGLLAAGQSSTMTGTFAGTTVMRISRFGVSRSSVPFFRSA